MKKLYKFPSAKAKDVDEVTPSLIESEATTTLVTKSIEASIASPSTTVLVSTLGIQTYIPIALIPLSQGKDDGSSLYELLGLIEEEEEKEEGNDQGEGQNIHVEAPRSQSISPIIEHKEYVLGEHPLTTSQVIRSPFPFFDEVTTKFTYNWKRNTFAWESWRLEQANYTYSTS
ncbi:hypothetical protein ACFE04_002343 [Oxalis oulophora]